MDAENGELFAAGVAADGWQLDAPFSCSDLVFSGSAKPLQDWVVDPDCTLNDSESEDVLHGVDPNEVFPSGLPADCSSESDSGISEDPVAESPFTAATATTPQPATVYQVVYDISGLGAVKTEPGLENVISIELDAWSSQMLFPDSCVVNELPVAPPARLDGRLTVGDPPGPDAHLLSPELQLTEEEQKLLTKESLLPNNLSPRHTAEERILKRVRRKIRNKQSAQDSRRRRKEYIDGLEGRAAACSAQNKELQRTVEQLEKRNMSLLSQLRQLQSLIKQTVSKGAQTSTCLLIILVSLGLIILPSFSPFSRSTSADDDYRPTGVISRNILTDPSSSSSSSSSSSQPTADNADAPAVPPAELGQSEPPDGTAGFDGTAQEGSQSGNGSALVAGETETEPLALGLRAAAGKGSRNPAKPAHADEM
ncbi:cyclic AMP-responsive element-binding protein 3-like protein 4 [Perca fluviatilis]|uniref:cyclic AMP-responsive element-binding protein 3-like protein 4 n=1 Tax=Perca fluviatilis TaxID=8168 RepID=UPI0019652CA5|nr:cyclic AMP-responsive element-binding protein 3-like protein 4 [Perca fluviatilis]